MIGAGLAITHRLVVSYVMTVGYIAITTGGMGYEGMSHQDIYNRTKLVEWIETIDRKGSRRELTTKQKRSWVSILKHARPRITENVR